MKIILLVEPEDSKRVSENLVRKGFEVCILDSIDELIDRVKEEPFDVVVCDFELLFSYNRGLLNEVKNKNAISKMGIPLLAIVSKDSLRWFSEEVYFTDFIVKPFVIEELLIRILRLTRIKEQVSEGVRVIRCGDLYIDEERCKVIFKGRVISLTFKEYELLRLLVLNKGKVFRREELLSKLWGYDYYGGDRTVDTHISRLRNKLGDYDHRYIQTVRNIGYKFSEGEEDEEA
ncbi:MAG: response regulator transcription factor [Synergistetes bacterium]|nr:response regulator transcription factor [Synergistota bacterium]MCX8128014.1 response regulator transcription factor [Synergistota bacterium]MDW8192791.1 response regulator transcription factor [Synergistota bacterium]